MRVRARRHMLPLSWPVSMLSDRVSGCQFVGGGGATLRSALAPSAGDKTVKSDLVSSFPWKLVLFLQAAENFAARSARKVPSLRCAGVMKCPRRGVGG